MLGEHAGLWTVELDTLPVGHGETFKATEDIFPVQEVRKFLVEGQDELPSRLWAVKVLLPSETKEPFNPAFLLLNTTTMELTRSYPTESYRYLACLTLDDA
ncbi:hypothetical protein ABZ829_14015 [Streptomyces xanthochromogenes]|uniref:hypothetical protein n=1 Tax=Streptomyces xanthochromogenes TaxID=67384 RepID=UPI0034209FD8